MDGSRLGSPGIRCMGVYVLVHGCRTIICSSGKDVKSGVELLRRLHYFSL